MEEPEKTTAIEQPQTTPAAPLEDQLKAMQAEKDRLSQELKAAQKGLSTMGQDIRKKEEALNRQTALERAIMSQNEQFKLLAAYVAEGQSGSSEDFEEAKATRKPDLLKKFEELETKRKADEEQSQQRAQIEQFTNTVAGYEERVKSLGLTENDETYWDIKGLVETAFGRPDNLKRADVKIKKLEEAKMTDKKETEEQRIARLVEEGIRKKMDEQGLLKPEGGSPSGASSQFEQIEKDFAEGNVDWATYNKARKEHGI